MNKQIQFFVFLFLVFRKNYFVMFYDFFEIENLYSILFVRFFYIIQKNASSISIHEFVSFNIDEQKFEIHKKITNIISNAYVIDR